MSDIHYNDRPCEVCGQQDLKCAVASSGLGPASFNTCPFCAILGAEMRSLVKGMKEEGLLEDPCLIPVYDCELDEYRTDLGPVAISFKDGWATYKRTEAVVHLKEMNGE